MTNTNNTGQAVAAFNVSTDLLAEIDRRAEGELITRAAWLRRAVVKVLRSEKEASGPLRRKVPEPA